MLKNATVITNFGFGIAGEDTIFTIPKDYSLKAWSRMIYNLKLDANYMYMLIAKSGYNGFGRLGISNYPNRSPWEEHLGRYTGNHALGFFPAWSDEFERGDYADWDTHAIKHKFDYCYFYLQKESKYTELTIPFEIWFCGDTPYNEAQEEFNVNLALYKQRV